MPKITAHAMVRYAERIKHIRVKDHNVNNINTRFKERYIKEINKMYQFSRLIYSGVCRDYKKSNFRLANDIILILDTQEKNIITLFRVDFGLLKEQNKEMKNDILCKLESEQSEIINIENIISNDKFNHSILEQKRQFHIKEYSKLAESICYSVDSRVKRKASL